MYSKFFCGWHCNPSYLFYNHGQKCWHIWAKQTLSFSIFCKKNYGNQIFLSIAEPPSPSFQFWNTLCGQGHVVTTSKGKRGWKCENWRLKLVHSMKQVFWGGVSQLLLFLIVASMRTVWKRRKIQFWMFWNCLGKVVMIYSTVLKRKYSKIFQDVRFVNVFVFSAIWVC